MVLVWRVVEVEVWECVVGYWDCALRVIFTCWGLGFGSVHAFRVVRIGKDIS